MSLKQLGAQAGKWLHVITQINKWIAVVTFVTMGAITTADVVGRYLLRAPVTGAYELVMTLMLVLVYSIFAFVAEVDFNIRVDIFFARFSKRTQARLDIFSSLACILMMSVMTWQLGTRVINVAVKHTIPDLISAVLPWSLWPFTLIATIGCGVLVLELIAWFLRSISRATATGA